MRRASGGARGTGWRRSEGGEVRAGVHGCEESEMRVSRLAGAAGALVLLALMSAVPVSAQERPGREHAVVAA